MKANTRLTRCTVLLAVAALLTACSDSDNKGGGAQPPPPAATKVIGTVSTATGALDQFVQLELVPTTGTAVKIPVAANGTFSQDVAAGTYKVVARRPGYDTKEQVGFQVVASQNNTLNVSLTSMPKGEYIKSANCGVCHEAYYESFRQTGHPYKITQVANGQTPVLPFTSKAGLDGGLARVTDADGVTNNALGTPQGWGDVSYLIGGFHWKARWMDKDGYIVTGTATQWNIWLDRMVAYNATTVNLKFSCGNCHTTGWRAYDASVNPNRQDNLPGMDGTFAEAGIQCEACHGAGSGHAQSMSKADITRKAQFRTTAQLQAPNAGYGLAIACGECHSRDSERHNRTLDSAGLPYSSPFDRARDAKGLPRVMPGGRIPSQSGAGGPLGDHHQQIEEIWSYDPVTLQLTRSASFLGSHGDCMTCHNPHGSTVKKDDPNYTGMTGVDSSNKACLTCHSLHDPQLRADGGMKSLDCIDCHMPKVTRTAERFAAKGVAPATGDIRTHTFKIRMSHLEPTPPPQFTSTTGNGFMFPYITTDHACRTCHNGVDLFTTPDDLLIRFGFRFHNNLPTN